MATFPSLTPSAAPITPGAWPVTATSSLNGAESRIRHGSAEIGRRLALTFTNISEADFLAILAHYRGQRSGFDSFGFSTTTLAADLTPSGHAWLYASPPQVVDEHQDVFTVNCEFKCEPRGLVVAMGKAWRTGASTFTPGSRSGGAVVASGVGWVTSSTTLTPGSRSSGIGSNGVAWVTNATTLSPGTARDPHFSSVSILLHMDGANNSTTFTDSSSNALTVTPYGNAKITTSRSKYGEACGRFDGSSHLQIADGAWANLAAGATIEMWFYANSLSSSLAGLISKDTQGVDYSWGIILKSNELQVPTANTVNVLVCSATIPVGQWNHVAVQYVSGSGIAVWLNGSRISPGNGHFFTNESDKITVGCLSWNSPSSFFDGDIDDLRITKVGSGGSRYDHNASSITVPAGAFPDN